MFTRAGGIAHASAEAASRAIATYGTPVIVYDADTVRASIAALRNLLPPAALLHYAVKANPLPDLLRIVAKEGLGFDVSSAQELEAVLSAKTTSGRVLGTGPAKDAWVRRGVDVVYSVESRGEWDRFTILAERVGPLDIVMRVRVGSTGGLPLGEDSHFGMLPQDIASVVRDAPAGLRVRGLHVFAASNVVSAAALRANLVGAIVAGFGVVGSWPDHWDLFGLGGGFPVRWAGERPNELDQVWSVLDEVLPDWRVGRPTIFFESGRAIVGRAGTLYVSVLDVRHSTSGRVVVCDAGTNAMGVAAGLFARHPRQLEVAGEARPVAGLATVVGPLCTPYDVIGRSVPLPEVSRGDVIAVPDVGAYGLSASPLAFISQRIPSEVVVSGGEFADASTLTISRMLRHG